MKNLIARRALMVSTLAVSSALAAGAAFADKAPPPRADPVGTKRTGDGDAAPAPAPAPTPTPAPAPTPAPTPPDKPPAVWRIKDTRPARLPDGVFVGRLEGGTGQLAELRVTIVAGRVTEGVMRRPGNLPVLDLLPVESGDSIQIRLQGSSGSEFVRINGAFFDAERGAGRFDGVLGRVKTTGTWLLSRR